MPELQPNRATDAESADPRWQGLYRIGAIACIAFVASIVFAIAAYFIWPYKLGGANVENIFATLQDNRLAGLMSLELQMLIVQPIICLAALALYAALKRVNESYALIALVLELLGVLLMFTARPVAELVYLSDQYAAATSELAKIQYLAAGETYLALYEGTAWMWANILMSVSGLISSLLMLRSKIFSRATAFVGIAISIAGLGFWMPMIGALLSLLATIGGVLWYVLLARTFFWLGWDSSNVLQAS